jgi:hypothetical protein
MNLEGETGVTLECWVSRTTTAAVMPPAAKTSGVPGMAYEIGGGSPVPGP